MAKKKKDRERAQAEGIVGKKAMKAGKANEPPKTDGHERMGRREYEEELRKLQVKLCYLQDWLKESGHRCIVVMEGRDAAGKGGTIKAITERVSPRYSGSLPCPRHRIVKRARCTSSAISGISRRPARWSSSTAVGTTVPASIP